jgi:arylsulfatase A-like enzyme
MPQPTVTPLSVERPGSVVALAVWAGVVTGFAEVAVIAVTLFGPGFAKRGQDAIWMMPAFDGALFGLIGILLVVLDRRARLSWHMVAGLLAGMGTFLVLFLVPTLHRAAAVVLAAGVGTQVAGVLSTRLPGATRVVQRSVPWLLAAVGLLSVATLGSRVLRERWLVHTRPEAQRGAPNVLLLILDTVRAADLSLYGYARLTTPELERFAKRGTVFDRAFAPASWTLESHASMFTGRWAFDLDASPRRRLGPRWPTLAEALRGRGYATAAFVANQTYAGWESGLSRGFEHFEDYPVTLWTASNSTGFGQLRWAVDPLLNRLPLLWRLHIPEAVQQRSARQINNAFLTWLDRPRRAPFFAFLNFMDAHIPYVSPRPYRELFRSSLLRPASPKAWGEQPADIHLTPADLRPKQDAYDGSIAYLDSELGRLFRDLERRGVLENTLVIVASDHGEEFAEHNGLIDHGNSLYRLSLWVPLVVRFPGHVPEGWRVATAASLRNLSATILDLTGQEGPQLPGRSLARFWTATDTTADTIVASVRQTDNLPLWFPVSQSDLYSIAFDGWRYIRSESTEELYDFEHDILERWSMLESDSGQRLLRRYRGALAALVPATEAPPLSNK